MFKSNLQLNNMMKIYNSIKGITLINDFIDQTKEQELLDYINNQQWSNIINRRTQHYGYEYNYNKKNTITKAQDLPDIFKDLFNNNFIINDKTQIIINEYLPGQGIADHIDSLIFDNKIMSLSLNSDSSMVFTNIITKEQVSVYLPRRSLLIIEDEARYKWYHGINKKKSDKDILDCNNKKLLDINRNTRISITIRSLK
ncbi:2OG-FeII oxygenase [Hokovirus HKV1]|uniref:2OG-FeII oxygenase n=1 Tax=Hokovirus HKV1 TaxID=1977638 RepID=A0A1V0SFS1_9VIRU|nr:2OG-FeII oxygenase [Hokovirus HKV1]